LITIRARLRRWFSFPLAGIYHLIFRELGLVSVNDGNAHARDQSCALEHSARFTDPGFVLSKTS